MDDRPLALSTHHRQHGTRHPDDAEEVRLELSLRFLDGRLLDCTDERIPRVVNQHVQPFRPGENRSDARLVPLVRCGSSSSIRRDGGRHKNAIAGSTWRSFSGQCRGRRRPRICGLPVISAGQD
jgi:hypothetical protein